MAEKAYDKFDVVEMKKPHACGANSWKIVRMGMDIKIKCLNCDHVVTMVRRDFDRKLKRVVEKAAD